MHNVGKKWEWIELCIQCFTDQGFKVLRPEIQVYRYIQWRIPLRIVTVISVVRDNWILGGRRNGKLGCAWSLLQIVSVSWHVILCIFILPDIKTANPMALLQPRGYPRWLLTVYPESFTVIASIQYDTCSRPSGWNQLWGKIIFLYYENRIIPKTCLDPSLCWTDVWPHNPNNIAIGCEAAKFQATHQSISYLIFHIVLSNHHSNDIMPLNSTLSPNHICMACPLLATRNRSISYPAPATPLKTLRDDAEVTTPREHLAGILRRAISVPPIMLTISVKREENTIILLVDPICQIVAISKKTLVLFCVLLCYQCKSHCGSQLLKKPLFVVLRVKGLRLAVTAIVCLLLYYS